MRNPLLQRTSFAFSLSPLSLIDLHSGHFLLNSARKLAVKLIDRAPLCGKQFRQALCVVESVSPLTMERLATTVWQVSAALKSSGARPQVAAPFEQFRV